RRGRSGSWSPTPRFGRGTELSRRGKAPQPAFRGPRPRFPPARQPRVPRRAHVPREAVVLGFVRFPVDPSPDRRSEGGAHVGILLVHGAPVDLHVPVGTVLFVVTLWPTIRGPRTGAGAFPAPHIIETNSRPAPKSHSHGLTRGEPSRRIVPSMTSWSRSNRARASSAISGHARSNSTHRIRASYRPTPSVSARDGRARCA